LGSEQRKAPPVSIYHDRSPASRDRSVDRPRGGFKTRIESQRRSPIACRSGS
jgi:hypothetical protein